MQTLRRDRLCDRTEKHLQIFSEELFGSAKVALGKGSHRRTKNAFPLPPQSPAAVLRADPGGISAERRAFWCRTREAVTLKSARAGFSGMGSVFLTFCFQWFYSCRTDLDPGFSGSQKRSAPRGWMGALPKSRICRSRRTAGTPAGRDSPGALGQDGTLKKSGTRTRGTVSSAGAACPHRKLSSTGPSFLFCALLLLSKLLKN